MPGRLNLVTLGARDIRRQRAFYEALGWTTRSKGEDFAAFPLGGAVLALYPVEELAGEANLPLPEAGEAGPGATEAGAFRGFTCSINVENEGDVDAAIEAVQSAGGKVLAEPTGRDWGGRSAYFADPEGNVWEVAWLPGGAFDERGGLIWPF